jgi:carboxymethylenebutenolidase
LETAQGTMKTLLRHLACITAAEAIVHATLVPIKLGDDRDIPVYVAGSAAAPAIIVIQEWWGVDEGTKQKALRLAQQGYRVLIPDIYKGKKGVNAEDASHLMGALDFAKAVEEISAAAAYLKATGSPKVGVVGFCMGGALAMGALAASDDIVAGAPFYGVNFGLFDVSTLKKPVQGHFGALDTFEGFADPATGKKLEKDLALAGNAHAKVHIYEGVGHAFMNESPAPFASFDERQEKMGFPAYDVQQADLAWGRLLDFFLTHLASVPDL